MGGLAPLDYQKVLEGGIMEQFRALTKVLNQLLFREIGEDVQTDHASVVIGEVKFQNLQLLDSFLLTLFCMGAHILVVFCMHSTITVACIYTVV